MIIEAGTRIGKYEIQSLLGVGGMGEVYRAQDTELKRPVALKFLQEDVASDEQRMQRLIHEARAASALNHPNILTVYDICQTDGGARFFVTEFVNGVTLRERMRGDRLSLGEVLSVGAQVASALVAAHEEGIVHRDIKPENLMLRSDRVVKVLDFGMAKLVEPQGGAAFDTEAPTRRQMTTPGTLMGTVAYMSPEQARGGPVDERTDVWSLGVVLYEMLTGRQPFEGKSESHVLVSIQEDEPPPLARHAADAPELLREIVSDALTKDRGARPTAGQALAKLERLKRRLDAGVGLDRESDAPARAHDSRPGAGLSAGGQAATSWAESLHKVARSGRRVALAAALALAALGGLASVYFLMWRTTAPRSDAPVLKPPKLIAEQVSAAFLSPDGKYFACVTSRGGRQSLWLRDVAEPSRQGRRIKPPAEVNPAGAAYAGVAFSPDGDYLYYIVGENNRGYGALYRMPLKLDDEPQKIVSDASGTLAVSPDGKRIAFKRHLSKTPGAVLSPPNEEGRGKQPPASEADYDEDQLLVRDEDRAGEREDRGAEQALIARRAPDSIGSLAWSPDGRVIAYVSGREDQDGSYENIEAVGVADGKARTISSARWGKIGSLVWLSDGSGLVITGKADDASASEPSQIWYVPYPGGKAQEVVNGIDNYASLSGNANALLAVLDNRFSEIFSVLPGADDAPTAPILKSYQYINSLAWTPGGQIVFDSEEGGNYGIWRVSTGDLGKSRLTSAQDSDTMGAVSPDGSIIYRSYHRKASPGDRDEISLRRMDADGEVRGLVHDLQAASAIHVSPDSQWVYYTAPDESGTSSLWKVSVRDGGPTKVRGGVESSRLSPDGRQFVAFDATPNPQKPDAPRRIIVFPADGGEPVWKHDAPPDIGDMLELDWSPDGQAINYVAPYEGVPNVWRLPLRGGRPQRLTDWNSDGGISCFAWSRDGKHLGVVRHTATAGLALIQIKDSR